MAASARSRLGAGKAGSASPLRALVRGGAAPRAPRRLPGRAQRAGGLQLRHVEPRVGGSVRSLAARQQRWPLGATSRTAPAQGRTGAARDLTRDEHPAGAAVLVAHGDGGGVSGKARLDHLSRQSVAGHYLPVAPDSSRRWLCGPPPGDRRLAPGRRLALPCGKSSRHSGVPAVSATTASPSCARWPRQVGRTAHGARLRRCVSGRVSGWAPGWVPGPASALSAKVVGASCGGRVGGRSRCLGLRWLAYPQAGLGGAHLHVQAGVEPGPHTCTRYAPGYWRVLANVTLPCPSAWRVMVMAARLARLLRRREHQLVGAPGSVASRARASRPRCGRAGGCRLGGGETRSASAATIRAGWGHAPTAMSAGAAIGNARLEHGCITARYVPRHECASPTGVRQAAHPRSGA